MKQDVKQAFVDFVTCRWRNANAGYVKDQKMIAAGLKKSRPNMQDSRPNINRAKTRTKLFRMNSSEPKYPYDLPRQREDYQFEDEVEGTNSAIERRSGLGRSMGETWMMPSGEDNGAGSGASGVNEENVVADDEALIDESAVDTKIASANEVSTSPLHQDEANVVEQVSKQVSFFDEEVGDKSYDEEKVPDEPLEA